MNCNCLELFKNKRSVEPYFIEREHLTWYEFWDHNHFRYLREWSTNELIEAWHYTSAFICDIEVLNYKYFSNEAQDKCLMEANLEFFNYINADLECNIEDLECYANSSKEYQDNLIKIQSSFELLQNELKDALTHQCIKDLPKTKALFENHLKCLKASYPKE
ncbi:hypothetical protein GE118_03600 [Mycoplasma sp. NEAQ87857]|uniref:hypothetical protein n=1 Tax=Mycoplasma sp. NEAQ87857 TaxID=2683967 RepID=UPI001315BE3F|nr:hypothetical protein [Mycoplasma sp. NEAQ87857]QGZ97240.1 hypothetical protein GE118_00280 [Mycoplasma sp. NEAQ87857]QGZ97867.1 hypothetical protein GE118_03600 [Mycoplasma sp. NEAQ87857]